MCLRTVLVDVRRVHVRRSRRPIVRSLSNTSLAAIVPRECAGVNQFFKNGSGFVRASRLGSDASTRSVFA